MLDRKLIVACRPALEKGVPVKAKFAIKNSDRTTGAMLAGELCRRFGEKGLPEGSQVKPDRIINNIIELLAI